VHEPLLKAKEALVVTKMAAMLVGAEESPLVCFDNILIDALLAHDRVIQSVDEQSWYRDRRDSVHATGLSIIVFSIFKAPGWRS